MISALLCLQVLEHNGSVSAAGGILLVMTDGQENVSPYIAQVRPTILQKKVIVDSILYTANADLALKNLSEETCGRCNFVSGTNDSSSLYDALSDTVRSRINDVRQLPVTVGRFTLKYNCR